MARSFYDTVVAKKIFTNVFNTEQLIQEKINGQKIYRAFALNRGVKSVTNKSYKVNIPIGYDFDSEGNIIGGIKYGDESSIMLVSSDDIRTMKTGVQQGKKYEVMHYHPGMDKDALIPSYSDIMAAGWDELSIGAPVKQSISHYKGSDVFYNPGRGEASVRVKVEMKKYQYATYGGLGMYGKVPQRLALHYIKNYNRHVDPPIDLYEISDLLDTAEQIGYRNRIKAKSNVLKDESVFNVVEESPIKSSNYGRSVYKTKSMKGGATSNIAKNMTKGYPVNSASKLLANNSPIVSPASSSVKSSRITNSVSKSVKPYTYKGSSILYPSKSKSSYGGGKSYSYSPSYYPKIEGMPNTFNGKYDIGGGNGGGKKGDLLGGEKIYKWRNSGVLSDMMGGLDMGGTRKRKGKKGKKVRK
jgi:hypothetical protein